MAMVNKMCIVTGASSGIGSSIAMIFAKESLQFFSADEMNPVSKKHSHNA